MKDSKRHGIHIPIGNEIGCNSHWVPGGYTEGMMMEGIAHDVKNPNHPQVGKCDPFARDIEIKCYKGVL